VDWVFLGMLAVAWLISPIILLVAFLVARGQVRELRQRLTLAATTDTRPDSTPIAPAWVASDGQRYAPSDLENLLLLRLELQRLADSGTLAEARHQELSEALDQLWTQHLRRGGVSPGDSVWQVRRALAWNLLAQGSAAPPGSPPWQSVASQPNAAPGRITPDFSPRVDSSEDAREIGKSTPLPSFHPQARQSSQPPVLSLEPLEPAPPSEPSASPSAHTSRPPIVASAPSSAWEPAVAYAADWRPAEPNPLERVLHAVSGWPRLIAPFLAQNIGWFIGGFCFIAGALFLIATTRGFLNALVVFVSLLCATAFLLWAGYQFRRKRPELGVASGMLLTLGLLLAPLDLAVAVGLVGASAGSGLLLVFSVVVVAGTLAAFVWAALLVSGLMDRTLMGRYPWLLTALAAVQLAAPLALWVPGWPALAVVHGLLLGLLGYGLRAFTEQWLQRLFVDRQRTAYYAAGLLVYTATVSFVHLTWVWPGPLPAGYAGPFLMALCGLLFPVDAALKDWVHKYAFLSRFSFVLYSLSAVAVAIAVQFAPIAMLTLAMGAVLYGWVTWRYRTLPPLYLLCGCVAGLYGYGLAQTAPPAWHGLFSLPGLLALLGMSRWVGAHSRAIALQCLIAFGALLLGVTGWSLLWSAPGWLGCSTAALAAVLAYAAVRLALALPEADPRWAWADAAAPLLALVAVAVAPAGLAPVWEVQTAFGGLGLAALWSALGLQERRQTAISRTVFLSSALLNIGLALGLTVFTLWPTWLGRWEPLLALTLAGALLLWLSLALRRQALFYGALLCVGGLGALLKRSYFPGASTGLSELVAVLALWGVLWRWARRDSLREVLFGDEQQDPTVESEWATLLRTPLEQAMALLWSLGLIHLGQRWVMGDPPGSWPWIAGLAALTGLMLIGYFRRFRWVALPMLVGLAGLLGGLERIGWTLPWLWAVAVLYALLVWRLGLVALDHPLTQRVARVLAWTTSDGGGGRQQVEHSVRDCALLIATATVAASPALAWSGWSVPELGPALALSLALFGLISGHYQAASYAAAALVTLTVSVWLIGHGSAPVVLFGLSQPLSNVLLSLVLSGAAVGLEAPGASALRYWRGPLAMTSSGLYVLALAGAVLGFLSADLRLPGLLALLCLALLPVARPWPNAAVWRGWGLPVLLSALVASLAGRFSLEAPATVWLLLVWGYALWIGGNVLLPRWNARWSGWAVDPVAWPLLGLLSVLGSGAVGVLAGVLSSAGWLGGLALYLLLLLRNSAWPGLAWLAVAALTASGVVASGALEWVWQVLNDRRGVPLNGVIAALLWLNLLFLLGALWRCYGSWVAQRLGWRQSELATPLFWVPFAVLLGLLSLLLWLEASALVWDGAWVRAPSSGRLTGFAILLAATAGHTGWLRPVRVTAHVLVLALSAAGLAVWLELAMPLPWLPLAAALWHSVLLLAWRYSPPRWEVGRSVLDPWLTALPGLSLGFMLLLLVTDSAWLVCTLTLLLLAVATLLRGGWQGRRFWLQAGLGLALAGAHTAWLAAAPAPGWSLWVALAPWYALQAVLLLLAFLAVRRWLRAVPEQANPADANAVMRGADVAFSVNEALRWLLALGLFWLAIHGGAVVIALTGWGPSPWRFGAVIDSLAAGAAVLLLAGLALRRAWRRPEEPQWVYATASLLGLLALYGRLLTLGLTAATVGDTVALLTAGYAALALYRFTGLQPLYRLALLLPLLALATAPWQLASVWTGGTLLAAAVLYLSLATVWRNPWPLYLGVLALNGAVYLWAPLWAERYGLWQFYIVPAAVSVLALLHLHRWELRPSVLSGARLAALSALYAGAGLDVFLRPELGVFVLALALALLGVIAGIALRIRAFLYAGVAFLILNVVGQLLRFYPDQSLSRALILLGLGATITVGMVWFNLKREAILQRVRILRADLAAWE